VGRGSESATSNPVVSNLDRGPVDSAAVVTAVFPVRCQQKGACSRTRTMTPCPESWSLQRTLEIGSYQTAWAMLHRPRAVLVRPDQEQLSGTVEVDETFIGGEEPRAPDMARAKSAVLACD